MSFTGIATHIREPYNVYYMSRLLWALTLCGLATVMVAGTTYASHDPGGRIVVGGETYTWSDNWYDYDTTWINGLRYTLDAVSRDMAHDYTYTITLINSKEPTYDRAVKQNIRGAFQAWQDANNGTLSFKEILDPSRGDINILVQKSDDTYYHWRSSATYGDAVVGCVLDEPYTCTIRIYTEWDDDDDLTLLLNPEFVKHVTAHEIGHAFGLAHNPNPNDIMYTKGERADTWYTSKSLTTPPFDPIPEEKQILPEREVLAPQEPEELEPTTEEICTQWASTTIDAAQLRMEYDSILDKLYSDDDTAFGPTEFDRMLEIVDTLFSVFGE